MFKAFVSATIAFGLLFSAPGYALCKEPGLEKSIQQLVGEDYLYAIDFLFFSKLAAGELRFSETETPNVYQAELVGRTLGIASWLSGDRTQTYTSLMELTQDGSLRSIEHTSRVVKRKRGKWQDRTHHYRYDYETGRVVDEKLKAGVVSKSKEHDIPAGQQPVDMLTAFYNLRAGIYGPLVRGAHYLIPTYAKGEFTNIEVRLLNLEQQAKHGHYPPEGLLAMATVDPEIFDTDSGNLYVWFNAAGVPERGVVEDVIGAGDVRGYLETEGL